MLINIITIKCNICCPCSSSPTSTSEPENYSTVAVSSQLPLDCCCCCCFLPKSPAVSFGSAYLKVHLTMMPSSALVQMKVV